MTKPFTDHPMFMTAGRIANIALQSALRDMDCTDSDLFGTTAENTANRVVDDLTRLLLRAYDAKQSKAA